MKRFTVIVSALLFVLAMAACSKNGDNEIKVNVTGVSLSQDEITLLADMSETVQLNASVYPDNADIKDVIWESGNESVAYVDNDGNVYPCGTGITEVRVKTADGGFEAKCAVNVAVSDKRKANIAESYTSYNITLYDMVMTQMTASPISYDTSGDGKGKALTAHDEEVEGFANPKNFTAGYSKYQFLVLNEENGISAQTLDMYLNGKGALSGKGSAFKKAAEDNNLSEVYLVILSCLETKCGTLELANGMEMDGEIVYNLFRIGEVKYDLNSSARFAYEQGWTSVEKAIEGGAEWLSENYINNSRHIQNTLYKMRWDPDSPAANQYSAEVEWADNMANVVGPMLEAFPAAKYRLDIPVYKEGKAVAG